MLASVEFRFVTSVQGVEIVKMNGRSIPPDSLEQSFAYQVLAAHFGPEAIKNIISSRRQFPDYLQLDLQRAILEFMAPFNSVLHGLHQRHRALPLILSGLLIQSPHEAILVAPLQYQAVDVGEETAVHCLRSALWLANAGGCPVVVLMSRHSEDPRRPVVEVEIGYLPNADMTKFVAEFLNSIEMAIQSSRYYRGKAISLESTAELWGTPSNVTVHRLAHVDRAEVILDDKTMTLIDRNVFEFNNHRAALRALGLSTRKGVLFYGAPGNGKTHIIRYISSNLPDHTKILITAGEVGALSRYMALARMLQPSIVVIEDVDLIGRSRERMDDSKTEVLLNQLLNEMDGLREDADILFILTTNRPEQIEEALALRPGRIDQAIEIPLPDDACRARLIRLYGERLQIDASVAAAAVERTARVSAAFMKEMVRRLALACLSRTGGVRIGHEDVATVLDDMLAPHTLIGQRLLGVNV